MARNSPRRFHIADAIILIAATAVGLALTHRSMVLGAIPRNSFRNISLTGASILRKMGICRIWSSTSSRRGHWRS